MFTSLSSTPVSSSSSSVPTWTPISTNSSGLSVLKYKFKLIPLYDSISSNASVRSSCIGLMTIFEKSAKLSFNSSELLLKPVLVFAIPNNKGDVQLCDNIIFSRHSVLKVE